MNCLHHVTYGCTVVTHGAGQRCRKSRTSQSCTEFAASIRSSARCSGQNGSRLRCLSSPSIPISTTSRTIKRGRSCHRHQDCFHGETFGKVGGTPAVLCQCQRHITERYCEPRSGDFSPTEEKAWVNDREVGATPFNWNIGLIVCYRRSWNRSMSCWYRTGDGECKRQRLRRN